ncbi:unnamed protein product, partial [Notodromas monacha]
MHSAYDSDADDKHFRPVRPRLSSACEKTASCTQRTTSTTAPHIEQYRSPFSSEVADFTGSASSGIEDFPQTSKKRWISSEGREIFDGKRERKLSVQEITAKLEALSSSPKIPEKSDRPSFVTQTPKWFKPIKAPASDEQPWPHPPTESLTVASYIKSAAEKKLGAPHLQPTTAVISDSVIHVDKNAVWEHGTTSYHHQSDGVEH